MGDVLGLSRLGRRLLGAFLLVSLASLAVLVVGVLVTDARRGRVSDGAQLQRALPPTSRPWPCGPIRQAGGWDGADLQDLDGRRRRGWRARGRGGRNRGDRVGCPGGPELRVVGGSSSPLRGVGRAGRRVAHRASWRPAARVVLRACPRGGSSCAAAAAIVVCPRRVTAARPAAQRTGQRLHPFSERIRIRGPLGPGARPRAGGVGRHGSGHEPSGRGGAAVGGRPGASSPPTSPMSCARR